MERILIVEDNRLLGSLVKDAFERYLGHEVEHVTTLKEVQEIFSGSNRNYFLALVDVNLPDAQNGEAVDFVINNGVPVVVFTGGGDRKWHKQFWKKRIVDYVLKDGPDKLHYLIYLIQRLEKNKTTKTLVVDDSRSALHYTRSLLKTQGLITFGATSGQKALEILNEHNDIALVVTDYYMKDMNGDQLTKEIRKIKGRNQLAIIGISSMKESELAASFLKAGANDFVHKPLLIEEFFCRVNQNLQTLEYINTIHEMSNKDYLTGLYNRRYFFDAGNKIFELSKRQKQPISIAMLDIDYFKKINDTYGHDAGDLILKEIAELLQQRFRKSDIVARFGGEEFCILLSNSPRQTSTQLVENCRKAIGEREILLEGQQKIKVSVSIGLCNVPHGTLDEMIGIADQLLYQAKQTGRNKLEHD